MPCSHSRYAGQAFHVGAVVVGAENVVSRIDGPHVALAMVGLRRAGIARKMCGGIEDVLVIGQEIAAGGAALAEETMC